MNICIINIVTYTYPSEVIFTLKQQFTHIQQYETEFFG